VEIPSLISQSSVTITLRNPSLHCKRHCGNRDIFEKSPLPPNSAGDLIPLASSAPCPITSVFVRPRESPLASESLFQMMPPELPRLVRRGNLLPSPRAAFSHLYFFCPSLAFQSVFSPLSLPLTMPSSTPFFRFHFKGIYLFTCAPLASVC